MNGDGKSEVHCALSGQGSPARAVSIMEKNFAEVQVTQRRVKKMFVHRSLIIYTNEHRALS